MSEEMVRQRYGHHAPDFLQTARSGTQCSRREDKVLKRLERVKGIGPSTRSLGSYCSTTELHPRPASHNTVLGRQKARLVARPARSPHREIRDALRYQAFLTILSYSGAMTDLPWHAPNEIRRSRPDGQRRTSRARRARCLTHAVDQYRQPLQYRVPQLLYRVEPGERPARLYDARRGCRLSRRDRQRRLAGARDRLHRRRAVHEPRHYRDAWRRARRVASRCWC